ncbi:hypothetical protein TanjilG_14051 [Lupinus angustifolius]|uniref:Uncharacterized protein n=1 Tax=Lupinus angustifolius TaxID=3871 RepID=A0A394DB18_LUPAN|nr:hypothetical protein TanjilG_14050 [Lupinus angustifolius]OIW20522.1 hypothetical protein TanjilG_14051 [Lupinus angustifolius]
MVQSNARYNALEARSDVQEQKIEPCYRGIREVYQGLYNDFEADPHFSGGSFDGFDAWTSWPGTDHKVVKGAVAPMPMRTKRCILMMKNED